jgi:hypothetical protein
MADINIQKKKKNDNNFWPWVLGIIGAVALIWILVEVFTDDGRDFGEVGVATEERWRDDEGMQRGLETDQPEADMGEFPEDVHNFTDFVNRTDAQATELQQYTSSGLSQLGNALGALAGHLHTDDAEITGELEVIDRRAEEIQTAETAIGQSQATMDGFLTAARTMESLQTRYFDEADDEIDNVRDAAEAIDPEVPLEQQREQVEEFFQYSSNALQRMVDQAPQVREEQMQPEGAEDDEDDGLFEN